MQKIHPGSGQESVWDYPRPPRLERTDKLVRVEFAGETVAETRSAQRILETSQPPTYYIPPQDVQRAYLVPSKYRSICEFKGQAGYWTLEVNDRHSENAGWFYLNPNAAYAAIKDYIAFYSGRVDACYVEGERVEAQAGDFYGGWITNNIVGPFKGAPGTYGW